MLTRTLFALGAAAVLSLPATDSLTDRTAGTLGTNWSAAIGAITDWSVVTGVGATETASGADFSVSYWNQDTFTDDQYAQVVLTIDANGYAGAVVRGSSGNAYGVSLEGGACTFYKWVSSSRSSLGTCSSHAWTSGHTLKLSVVGDALTVYDNGVSFGSTTGGSAVTSGKPGMLGYSGANSFTNWQGDNVGGAATFPAAIINAPIRCCKGRR